MANRGIQFVALVAIALSAVVRTIAADEPSVRSGRVTLSIVSGVDGAFLPSVSIPGGFVDRNAFKDEWIAFDVDGKVFHGSYSAVRTVGDVLRASGTVKSCDGVTFVIDDEISSAPDGAFDVRRTVRVKCTGAAEANGFFASIGFSSLRGRFHDADFFIPAAMYRNMFDPRANPEKHGLRTSDENFLFREDRLPLPLAMFRFANGATGSVLLLDTGNNTVLADSMGEKVNGGYRFGGVGFRRAPATDLLSCRATYPGCDRHARGLGSRRLPLVDGTTLSLGVRVRLSLTADYASALEAAWSDAVAAYAPKVRNVNSSAARKALLGTLYSYRQSPDGDQDLVKSRAGRPGFPWGVQLKGDFKVNDTTYEIGFVGCQPAAGYALLQAGVLENNAGWRKHGEAVVNFWATESLSELGFPKGRYYPLHNNGEGCWDDWSPCTLRQGANGFSAVLDAWKFMKAHGMDRPSWLEGACRFGEWLLANQAGDGSWAMSHKTNKVEDGRHPVDIPNKALTICAVQFLARLYRATGREAYRECAMKAAEFAYRMQHEDYLYVAGVIDNPQVHDSESGFEAMQGFLAAHDLDPKDRRWVDAARQAAVYTETWAYMHEVPRETDATEPRTPWPADRSVVGQHILTVDQPAVDLGFAWTAYPFHRVWKLTGENRFRLMRDIALHNTKQSMNLGGKLYPGKGEGLQLEASTIRTAWQCPRRGAAVEEALTWNFAAHLQQYASFLDDAGAES